MNEDYSNRHGGEKRERVGDGAGATEYDLRGVRCPLNWARARVRLEQMTRGALLLVRLDDPKGARDLPGAAEACGYAVLDVQADGAEWRILIQR